MNSENYNDLAAFLAVATEQSFTKAAIKLNLSQSALSHRIKQLERHLGIQLFARTTRSLALTTAGEQLFATVNQSLGNIDQAIYQLQTQKSNPSGVVRIVSGAYGITHVLIPKLAQLNQKYPDIRLELTCDESLNNIISEQFDAGVRWGYALQEGMIAQRIGADEPMAMVGSPAYFQAYGFPQTLTDLATHRCLAYRFASGGIYQWDLCDKGQKVSLAPSERWVLNSDEAIIEAAKHGVGLAYVPLGLVANAIHQGELIQVMKPFSHTFTGFHLYYPHRNVSPALKAVIELLKVS